MGMSREDFKPQINKKSAKMAAAKSTQKIEDRLIMEGKIREQKLKELERKMQTPQQNQLRKVSDKYILQKFYREYEMAML